jgi:phenylacetate-CoA ligase
MGRRRGLGERWVGGVVYPLWAWREHPGYGPWRRRFERSQYWPAERLRAWQDEQLQALLEHAAARCPLYRARFREAGLEPRAWQGAWARLPLLTKADIQAHGAELEAADFPARARQRNQTGGSTGSPLQFWVDRRRYASRLASTDRHNAWAGLRPGDWVAEIWGHRLDLAEGGGWWQRMRRDWLYRTLEINSSRIEPGDWDAYVEVLRRYRPRFLVAYARAAVEFAEHVRRRGIGDVRFEAIITTAEVLLEDHRRLLEAALGGRVFNRYGCREVSVIASECGEHSGMHVNAEAILVEVIPAAGLPAPWGKIVVTDLLNRSMPLIRYEIGDVGRWAEGDCACGRALPRLAAVEGRTTDFLRLPGGEAVSGPALTLVFADLGSVRQVQFVQRGDGSVRLRVVPGPGYGPEAEAEVRRRLELYLRGAVPLAFEPVAAIASEASGKYRFVVQEAAHA